MADTGSLVGGQDAYYLEADDVKKLKELIRRFEQGRTEQALRRAQPVPVSDQLPPEVYLARTPVAGIPRLSEEPGTSIEDTPGYAECDIYRLNVNDPTSPRISPAGIRRIIHNIYADPIGGNRWILAHRDKYGVWYAGALFPVPSIADTGTGTGIGTGTHGDDPDPGDPWPGWPDCNSIYFYENELVCEGAATGTGTDAQAGSLNLYRREVTLNVVNGCLTKTTSGWYYVRTVACCDPTCASDISINTGTGTPDSGPDQPGEGGPILTSCCANLLPAQLTLTFTGSGGTCPSSNGTVPLLYNSVTGTWEGTHVLAGSLPLNFKFYCLSGGTSVSSMRLDVGDAAQCHLQTSIPPTVGPPNSCNPLSVTFGSSLAACCGGGATYVVTE